MREIREIMNEAKREKLSRELRIVRQTRSQARLEELFGREVVVLQPHQIHRFNSTPVEIVWRKYSFFARLVAISPMGLICSLLFLTDGRILNGDPVTFSLFGFVFACSFAIMHLTEKLDQSIGCWRPKFVRRRLGFPTVEWQFARPVDSTLSKTHR